MYDKNIEEKWRGVWEREKTYKFRRNDGRQVYVIDTPPPYTSGVLHMGHVLDFSFIDFLARYKRMKGFDVYYPQGWDTMGFPTERAVEKIHGKGLGTEEFIEKSRELAQKNLTAMRSQMISLGFSMDMDLEYITMSEDYQAKVQLSVIEMYEKGFVYRGMHAVYWCTYCRSAIAKEETEEVEEKTKLNYIAFDLENGEKITIATTRPEYLHACIAVAVNPSDQKNKEYIGKKAIVPIFGGKISVIGDESVKTEFGTGAEMVCTFGDKQDLIMYHRHKLNGIRAVDEAGRLLNAGKLTGTGIKDARSTVIGMLKEEGRLLRQDEILHSVKKHDRCGNNIELLESTQWFIKTVEYADKIKEMAEKIEWVPDFTKKYLLDWADYIDWDWVISRNRKFDTPLPFWYCNSCGEIIPADKEKLPVNPAISAASVEKCPKCAGEVVGETLTCDVWIDSSITPLVVAGWPWGKEGSPLQFPTEIRVHATEIIRSWTFYTIHRVWALTGEIPFKKLLIHGLVLGPDNKKMSKSLGNVVSPDELISKFSSDSVRMWSALSGIIGRNKALVFNDVKYAYDFISKLFNSYAFIEKAVVGEAVSAVGDESFGIFERWMLSRLNRLIERVEKDYEDFNYMDASNSIIEFYWHEFCDFYLENVKHVAYGEDKERKAAVSYVLSEVLEKTLLLLAPIIPFATEELYSKRGDGSVHLKTFPEADRARFDEKSEKAAECMNGIIAMVRRAKTRERLALNYELTRIIINLPDEYYGLVESQKQEVARICKARDVALRNAPEPSVEIEK